MTHPLLTRFLTGDLVGILIAAAILTWPVSWGLLALYRRAVHRSMRRAAGTSHQDAQRNEGPPLPDDATAVPSRATLASADAEALLNALLHRPRRAARIYMAAAVGYAATIALVTARFADPEAPFVPVRLVLLTTGFAWPLVLTVGIVAGAVRRQRVLVGVAYAATYLVLIGLAITISSTTSTTQLLLLWAMYNLPTTALVALCLSRRIRAVGPLVLLFLVLGLLGAEALIGLVGGSDNLMAASVDAGGRLGLGGVGTFFAIAGLGFVAFAVVGAAMLFWISRRYERKRTSEESLTIHTIWWLFVFGYAIELAFEHPLAPLSGVVAMIVFALITRIGFRSAARNAGAGYKLLLLRSFSIGPRAEEFFDAFEKHWRRVGSIEMIAGVDLATRTIEPHEFLGFVTGKVSRRFIDGRPALAQRLDETDTRPDRDGRFRVNEFFCYDDTWRDVLLALVRDVDAVLMDLRGFSRQNAGCVFEIGELFRLLPIGQIVFLVDRQTDDVFLQEVFARASAFSPTPPADVKPTLLSCDHLDTGTLRDVFEALARAVRPSVPVVT